MRIKKKIPTVSKIARTCAWCETRIPSDSELFALGVKKRSGLDISKYEGKVLPMKLLTLDKTIYAIVTTADSDARKEGKDMMLTICSHDCGMKLKEAIKSEINLGDIFEEADFL